MQGEEIGTGTTLPWRQLIPVGKLRPNKDNPRGDPGDLAGLARSIEQVGLKQWLLVRPQGDEFVIEDGWRRYLAMKDRRTEIPCIVFPALSSEDLAQQDVLTALVTDVHKKNLNPMERARGFARLQYEFGMDQKQIADLVGKSVTLVSNSLALLELAPNVQRDVERGGLSVEDALAFVRRRRRAARRKKGGSGPAGAVWEPDHFTVNHPLARAAERLCNARTHNTRRRRVKSAGFAGACDDCWEDSIRADERTVIAATRSDVPPT